MMLPNTKAVEETALIEPKIDLNVDLYCNWNAVLAGRFESPGADGLDCFFIQPHAKGALNPDLVRAAVVAHDHPKDHDALVLGFPRLFRELWIRRVNDPRSADTAPDSVDSPTDTSSPTRSYAWTMPRTHSAATPTPDTSAGSRPVRWRAGIGRKWIAERASVRQHDVRRYNDCGFGCQLRTVIPNHDGRWGDLLGREPWQGTLRRCQFIPIATPASSTGLGGCGWKDVWTDIRHKSNDLFLDGLPMGNHIGPRGNEQDRHEDMEKK